MLKGVIRLAFLLFLLPGCAGWGGVPTEATALVLANSSAADVAQAGGVAVVVVESRKNLGYCNGVALTPSWVLTVGHCCTSNKIFALERADVYVQDDFLFLEDAEKVNRSGIVAVDRCVRRGTSPERSVRSFGKFSHDLALLHLTTPLSPSVMPAQRVDVEYPLKEPILDLDSIPFSKLQIMAGSRIQVEIPQLMSPGRFFDEKLKPAVAKHPIVGFDERHGLVLLAEVESDLIAYGSSGAGFYVREKGQRRLLAILSATYPGHVGNFPLAVDIRPHRDWIDGVLSTVTSPPPTR